MQLLDVSLCAKLKHVCCVWRLSAEQLMLEAQTPSQIHSSSDNSCCKEVETAAAQNSSHTMQLPIPLEEPAGTHLAAPVRQSRGGRRTAR